MSPPHHLIDSHSLSSQPQNTGHRAKLDRGGAPHKSHCSTSVLREGKDPGNCCMWRSVSGVTAGPEDPNFGRWLGTNVTAGLDLKPAASPAHTFGDLPVHDCFPH